jgi:4-coumarate--CoA ligase
LIGSERDGESYSFGKLKGEDCKKTVATLNYSSGTTGLPKTCLYQPLQLSANLKRLRPTSHHPDCPACKLQIPVYVMKAFVFEDFLRTIQNYRINRLQVPPPILVMLAKRLETAKYDISCVENVVCGALGYWKNEKELLVGDGWLRTGDVAVRDENVFF